MYDLIALKSEKRYKILSMYFLKGRSITTIADQLGLPKKMVDDFLKSDSVKKIRTRKRTYLKELTRGFSYVLIDENHPDRSDYGV